MKLSIITINRNNALGLEKTLRSVATQTCKDFEHIIIDGSSTDNSVEVIKQYVESTNKSSSKTCHQIKWISEPDKGIYNAMNKGIRMALDGKADYIQILNSGDCLYAEDVIERMFRALKDNDNPAIMYGNMIRDIPGKKHSTDKCLGQHDWTMYDFICGTINHDPTYIRRDIYEKYGLYRKDLPITADWRWFVEAVALGGEKPVYVPIDVTLFDVSGISETQLERRELERDAELRKILPLSVYKDYRNYHFPIEQIKRLKRHPLAYKLFYLLERMLFKFEKWGILKK